MPARCLPLLLLAQLAFAQLPQPTLQLDFEDGLTPAIAAPGAAAESSGELRFVDGVRGRALEFPAAAMLSYPTAGHLRPEAGTVAMWLRAPTSDDRPRYGRLFDAGGLNHALFLAAPINPYVKVYGSAKVAGEEYVPWPMGDASLRGSEWQHVALTWGPGGATLYLNGVTLTATDAMPPLPGLPERFYLGNDAGGGNGLASAIDEVYLFDRPLRSLELTRLMQAGRPDAGDPDLDFSGEAANWLPNSSFEVGPTPWVGRLWSAHGSQLVVAEGEAHSGRHAYLMDRRADTAEWWGTTWLVGPWLHRQRDEQVTFSAWVKADRADVEIALDIQPGGEGRAVRGATAAKTARRDFRVGTDWQRLVLTTTLPIAYKDGYRPRICLTGKGCRVWIDDLQMAAGGPRAYAPAAPLEMGWMLPGDRALFVAGEPAAPRLGLYLAPGEAPRQVEVDARASGGAGAQQPLLATTLQLAPGVPVTEEAPLAEVPLGDTRLWARAGAATAALHLAGLPPRDEPPPIDGPFGTHGGDPEAMLAAGLSQYRDVSGFTWRWIERREGEWRLDERPERYAKLHDLGLGICATVADAPEWAARPGGGLAPAELAGWRGYLERIITAFADDVDIWEVWNEPDLKGLFEQDPALYVELARVAREVQRQHDPTSRLAGPCAAGAVERAMSWTEAVLERGLLAHVDLLAWHPYDHGEPEGNYLARLRQMNEMMDRHGGRKPMIFTEYGVGGVSDEALHIPWAADAWRRHDEPEQAAALVRQSVLGLWQGAVKLYWYQWDEERLQTGPDTFGLVRADTYRSAKPALLAYAQMARRLEHAALPPRRVETGRNDAWVFEFDTPSGPVTVGWTTAPDGAAPLPEGALAATREDLYGRPWAAATLGPEPVYWQAAR